jgi:hypothetical protein
MNAEFEGFLKDMPSHFELRHRASHGKEDLYGVKAVMPVSVDEISEIINRHGFAVVGLLDGSGYEVVHTWDPGDAEFRAFITRDYPGHDIGFRDLGERRVETSLWDAHIFRRELVGNPAVSLDDIALFYKEALSQYKDEKFLALAEGVPFADFIENYPRVKREFNDEAQEWRFDRQSKWVILRPDFYMDLERYMRRKGWLHRESGLSPAAIFHRRTGDLVVFGLDEFDVGGFWYQFGGNLDKNPGILETFERKNTQEQGAKGAVE